MNILQLLLILKAHKKLIAFTLLTSVAIVGALSMLLPKTYTATSSLVFNVVDANPVSGQAMQSQLVAGYLATQIDVVRSRTVALRVVDTLKLAHDPETRQAYQDATQAQVPMRDWLAARLTEKLSVKPANSSNVLYVSYQADDPQRAARFANAFVAAYLQTHLALKTDPARQTAQWYNAQLAMLRNNLEGSQAKLSQYRQSKGIVSLDEKLDVETARLAELSSQVVAAQGMTYDSLSLQKNASDTSASVVNNPVVQGLKGELAKSESQLSQLSEKLGANHPEYQRAEAEVASLRDKLANESRVARQSLANNLNVSRQREGALRASLAAQKSRVLALNAERDVGAVLAHEVESAQRIYDQALERFSQVQMEGHAGQTEVALLATAVAPLAATSPNLRLNAALAALFGLLLGIGLALIREMLNRRVRSEYDVLTVLDVPVLGVLTSGNKPLPLAGGALRRPAVMANHQEA